MRSVGSPPEVGFSTRKLYTDGEEILFDAQRPVMLNGIADTVVRGDLMDRTITIVLPPIPSGNRRREKDVWEEFDRQRPWILGCLLDAVCCAIRNQNEVVLTSLPRMADFAAWVVAAETQLPWEPGEFMAAYTGNRQIGIQTALESDPVAIAVRSLMGESETGFKGTMTELLDALSGTVSTSVGELKVLAQISKGTCHPHSQSIATSARQWLRNQIREVGSSLRSHRRVPRSTVHTAHSPSGRAIGGRSGRSGRRNRRRFQQQPHSVR